jgi:hypothetical protein
VSANRDTVEYTGIMPNVEEFSEVFARLPISSLIDFHSGHYAKMLHKNSQDNMAFQATQGMDRPITLVQGSTNSESVFV